MSRRVFVFICLLLTVFLPSVLTGAQQAKKVSRIGLLFSGSSTASPRLEAFRQELGKLGYVEGQTIAFEYRFAEGNPDRLPELAAQLVRLKADVIVATAPPEIRAAKQATRTIPIVMIGTPVDPVAAGFVASLARPGGNITGLTSIAGELRGKRLELLKEAFPRLSRLAVLWPLPQQEQQMKEIDAVARALGIQIQSLVIRSSDDLESVFSAMSRKLPDALMVAVSRFIIDHRTRIIDFSTKTRLPAMYDESQFVGAGGLMSYSVDRSALLRRAAVYVDKILKGTKPADLPVEQPMKFELIINLKTAKQIGLTIPPNVLARADKVIK